MWEVHARSSTMVIAITLLAEELHALELTPQLQEEQSTHYGTAEGGSVWLYALLSLLVRLGGIAGVFTLLCFYLHVAKTKPTASSKKKTKHQFQVL